MARKQPREVRAAVVRACATLLLDARLVKENSGEHYVLRKLIDHLVWYYTETHDHGGKYVGCLKWSKAALERYKRGAGWEREVHLDHVVERKDLVDQLLKARTIQAIEAILERGETCVVLRTEHDDLLRGVGGWARYANIPVVAGPRVPVDG